ncbi:MAG TPA: hypothetical protein PKK78_15380 [Kouleothrix sp.]|nr:hypothetical protein [Kouleothrix sp.]
MSVDIDSKWLDEFLHRLDCLERDTKRIPLTVLRTVFAEVFAHRPGIPQRSDWLLEALRHAEREGLITLPRTSWDYTSDPALPKYVTRIQAIKETKNTWWKTYYWHPQLEWIADLSLLSEEYAAFLLRVQRGLMEGWFDQPAPLNRRSVELTGKEKRLRKLLDSSLFGPGRLNRDLLNITSDVLPLAYEIVGEEPVALVFENREPFNVALVVLQSISKPPYGILAYGGGGSFEDAVRDFSRIQLSQRYRELIQLPLQRIHYVGDLDWAGLRIAQGASRKAQRHGLPQLLPAVGIHQIMCDSLHDPRINHPDGFPDDEIKRARVPDESLLEWLPISIREQARHVLRLGNRIPEEMITAQALVTLWN